MYMTDLQEFDWHVWQFTEKWTAIRLIGEMTSVFEFWIPINTQTGQKTCVRKLCLDYDAATHSRRGTCPYCDAGLSGRLMYYSNAIIRRLQAAEPGADTDASPVRLLKIPPRLRQGLRNLASSNKRQSKATGERRQYGLAHPKGGRDVRIKINPDTPYCYYDLEPWVVSRLTPEERAYPLVPLVIKPESPQQARAAWNELKEIAVREDRAS